MGQETAVVHGGDLDPEQLSFVLTHPTLLLEGVFVQEQCGSKLALPR
jgi:hypothetical protein